MASNEDTDLKKSFKFKSSKCFRSFFQKKKYDESCDCEKCERQRKKLNKRKYAFKSEEWCSKVKIFSTTNKIPNSKKGSISKDLESEQSQLISENDPKYHSLDPISKEKNLLRKKLMASLSLRKEINLKLKIEDGWEMQLKNWFSDDTLRVDLLLLSVIAGISLRQANIKEKYFILENMTNILKPRKSPGNSEALQFYNDNVAETLCLATKCYFHFINPFFPLFTQKGFSKYPRSKLLKLVVWRVGLYYIPASSLRNSLTVLIDKALYNLLRLSLLVPTLDTMQSLLIFTYIIYTPSLSHLKLGLLGHISSIYYILGLQDSVSNPLLFDNMKQYLILERQLVINQLNFMGLNFFFREELPLVKPKHQLTFRRIEIAYYKYCSLKYKNIISMQEDVFTEIKIKCNRNKINLEQARLYESNKLGHSLLYNRLDIISSTLDLAILVHEYFFQEFIKILQVLKTKKTFVDKKLESDESYINLLNQAEKRLGRLFLVGVNFFDKLKVLRISSDRELLLDFKDSEFIFNFFPSSRTITKFDTFGCFENVNICQMQLILCIQYHYHNLEIMKQKTYIDFSINPPRISKTVFENKISLIVSKGIFSAVELLNLISMVSGHAFFFRRTVLVSSATRFIIQYFSVYSKMIDHTLVSLFGLPKHSTDPKNVQNILISALQKARTIFINTISAPETKYYHDSSLKMIDGLMKRYNIPIPIN